MRTITKIRTIKSDGWRGWDRISDKQAKKHGLPRACIVNPNDPYHVIYRPSQHSGYDNTNVRAESLDRHAPLV